MTSGGKFWPEKGCHATLAENQNLLLILQDVVGALPLVLLITRFK